MSNSKQIKPKLGASFWRLKKNDESGKSYLLICDIVLFGVMNKNPTWEIFKLGGGGEIVNRQTTGSP